MTAWAKMSKTKRCWVVYQVVRKLEPDACVSNIQKEIKSLFGVEIRADWLIKKLDNFTTFPDRNSNRVVLRQEWVGKTRHWRTTREDDDASFAPMRVSSSLHSSVADL